MFCKECGRQVEGAKFCSNCGTKVDDIETNYLSHNYDQPTGNSINEEREILKVLIGKNIDYYMKQLDKIEKGEKSFNWVTLLFPAIVLLYRKQYRYFFKMVLLPSCMPIIFALLFMVYFTTDFFAMDIAGVLGGIFSICLILAAVALPIYSLLIVIICAKNFNSQYLSHLINTIKNNQLTLGNINEPLNAEIIRKKYKPSAFIPMSFLLINMIIVLISSIISNDVSSDTYQSDNNNYGYIDENMYDNTYDDELDFNETVVKEIEEETTGYYISLYDMQSNGAKDLAKFYSSVINDVFEIDIYEKSKLFIEENSLLFPTTNDKDIDSVKSISKYVEYKKISKDVNSYLDSILCVTGYINDISRSESDDGTIYTHTQVIDIDNNVYDIMYLADVDVYKGDVVLIYGIPIYYYNYENVGGGVTRSILILGSHMEKEIVNSIEDDIQYPVESNVQYPIEIDVQYPIEGFYDWYNDDYYIGECFLSLSEVYVNVYDVYCDDAEGGTWTFYDNGTCILESGDGKWECTWEYKNNNVFIYSKGQEALPNMIYFVYK